jgi:hypothetical protein
MQATDFIFESRQKTGKHSIPSKRQIDDKQKSVLFGIFTKKDYQIQTSNKRMGSPLTDDHVTWQQSTQ